MTPTPGLPNLDDAADAAERGDVLRPVTPPADREIEECPVCRRPGFLDEFDPDKGFLIRHPGRLVACRAPANPPGVVDGELVVPVEVSEN